MSDVIIRVGSRGVEVLEGSFKKAGRAADQMGRSGTTAAQNMGKAVGRVSNEAKMLGLAIQAAVAGAAIKKVVDASVRWGVLQTKMKLSSDEARALKGRIDQASAAAGKSSDAGLAMLEVFQDFGGVTDKLAPLAPELLKFAAATGTADEDVARLAATMKKTLGLSNPEILESMATLNAQADAASMSFSELARIAPQIMSGSMLKGFKGTGSVTQIMPLVQLLKQTGVNAEEAGSSVRAMFADLSKESALKYMKGKGIEVFDKEGNMRNVRDIFTEIAAKTKGDVTAAANIFGESGKKVFDAFQAGVQSGTIDEVFNVKGSAADVGKLFERFSSGVAGPAVELQKNLSIIESSLMNFGIKVMAFVSANPASAALIGLGGFVAKRAVAGGVLGRLASLGGGAAGAGGAGGSGLGASSAPTPVFVTNFPGGGLPGGGAPGPAGLPGGGIPGGAGAPAAGPTLLGQAKQFGYLSSLGMVASAGLVGVSIGRAFAEATGSDDFLVNWQKNASKMRGEEYKKGITATSAVDQAQQLLQLKQSGVSTAEVAPGVRKEINPENFFPKLVEAARAQGLKGEEMQDLISKLDGIAKQMQDNNQITIINKSGVQGLEGKRGPAK